MTSSAIDGQGILVDYGWTLNKARDFKDAPVTLTKLGVSNYDAQENIQDLKFNSLKKLNQ